MSLPTSDDDLLLLHNPRCSKSRTLHAILTERGVAFRERLYLEEPLGAEELADLHGRLGGPAAAMVRSKEAEYAESGLSEASSDAEILAALARHPRLLERPVLVRGSRAALGRPAPDAALELLQG